MCSYKKTFELRQNTPIWQFQHMQKGATLRASEVKPKLDKFLIANCDSIKNNEDWFLGEALDYKLRIYSKGNIQPVGDKLSLFFANMGSSKRPDELSVAKKEAVFSKEGLCMEFFCLHNDLLDNITDKLLSEFFFVNNFGTRQSKGFGSFSVVDGKFPKKNEYNVGDGIKLHLKSYFHVNTNNHKELFEVIEVFSKSIRGGINDCKNLCFKKEPCEFKRFDKNLDVNLCISKRGCNCKKNNCSVFYLKSFLFHYVEKQEKQWDKRKIKQFFLQNEEVGEIELWRDMLGLAENTKLRGGALIKDGGEDFKRFKSPIFIKPVKENNGYIVYVGYYNTIEVVHLGGKPVSLKYKYRGGNDEILMESESKMAPLDLDDYFNFIINNGDELGKKVTAKKHEHNGISQQAKCENHKYYKSHLKCIYSELKKNYSELKKI